MTEAQFRKLVSGLPAISLDIKWQDHLVASIDGRMFAMLNLPHSTRPGHVHFKVDDELFLAITEQPGIKPAMYLARARWITVVEPQRYPQSWYVPHLRCAYELIAARLSRRRQCEIGLLH